MRQAVALGGWSAAGVAIVLASIALHALHTRTEAVARACHELRGPLTAARLGLQLGSRTGELSQTRLRAIDQELGRAALALDDLGGATARRPATRAVGPVDVAELVSDSVEAWRAFAAARGVELRAAWSGRAGRVWGERLRLAQASGNLISNAIEHGGGVVEVRGRALDGTVRIEVLDSGPGLPAPVSELTRRPRRGRGGRGRGLAIARAIAEEHGGCLAAAPAERGARLVLELPGRAAEQGPTAS